MDGYVFIAESQYGGKCHGCGDRYEVGDPIWWAKGQPCYHETCEPDGIEATPPPTGGTRAATAGERQSGATRQHDEAIAVLTRQLAEEVRARAAIARALTALGQVAADLLPAGDARVVAVTDALEELRRLTSTNPLDRAARDAAAADGEVPF